MASQWDRGLQAGSAGELRGDEALERPGARHALDWMQPNAPCPSVQLAADRGGAAACGRRRAWVSSTAKRMAAMRMMTQPIAFSSTVSGGEKGDFIIMVSDQYRDVQYFCAREELGPRAPPGIRTSHALPRLTLSGSCSR